MSNVSALILEDDDLTRLSVQAILESAGFQTVDSFKTAAQAISHAKKNFPQVAFLDVHLGRGPTGIDAAHQLRKNDPQIGIVFLTTFEDPRLLSESRPLPQGSQYLVKKDVKNAQTLLMAVNNALQGKNRRTKLSPQGTLSQLSATQLGTLRLIAQGLSNAEISRQRHVTEKSVEAVITRITKILGIPKSESVNQRVHLAKLYYESIGSFQDGR